MRITNSMLINELSRNLNNSMQRMDELQRQLTTGKKINKPSDDPTGLVKSLRLRTNLSEGQKYTANIGEAINFLETNDTAFYNVNEIMQRMRELTVKAATGTNETDSFKAIANEMRELNEQLKIIANTSYGGKYIFAGSNVTEIPYKDGNWSGNTNIMNVEIGVGVKIPINFNTRDFFMGRMEELRIFKEESGLSNIRSKGLQEGKYHVETEVLAADKPSSIKESQSYLGALANNSKFFYEDTLTAATLGISKEPADPADPFAKDSPYNGSLLIETKKVETGSGRLLDPAANAPKLELNRTLYYKDSNGSMLPIEDGDIQQVPYFTFNTPAGTGSAVYNKDERSITFSLDPDPDPLNPPFLDGDTITLNPSPELYDSQGNLIEKLELTFNDPPGEWSFKDTAKITVDIKGHVYDNDGNYKYVNLKNVELDMALGSGKELFRIPANLLPGGDDLIVWNNGGVLGGIDPDNIQLQAGDKTVISFAAEAVVGDKAISHSYEFKNLDGQIIGEGSHSFNMKDTAVDNQWSEYRFFTLNQETGMDYSGQIELQANVIKSAETAAEFVYFSGLFEFMDDVSRKVEQGKLPQVGNELAKHDQMLGDLLLMRSSVGARVNRLELQQNRLEDSKVNLSELLAHTEGANIAEVIMQLTMQENVYRAALAGGARIVQPSLMDFLR